MQPAKTLSPSTRGKPRNIRADYRDMTREQLIARVSELLAVQPGTPANDTSAPVTPAPPAPIPSTPTCLVPGLLQRAIARPERLHSTARRKVAYLQHVARSRTLAEAAARTGVDRRTVNRWQEDSPLFRLRVAEVLAHSRQDAYDDALLVAGRPRLRPIYYRGEKVGEYDMPNNALVLYVLKQAATAANNAEHDYRHVKRSELRQREWEHERRCEARSGRA